MDFDASSLLVVLFATIAFLVAILGNVLLTSLIKRRLVRGLLSAILGVAIACFSAPVATVVFLHFWLNRDRPKDLVYAPKTLQNNKEYPLLLILSPIGEPWFHMRMLRAIADKYQWIIAGDDIFRNGKPLPERHLLQTIRNVQAHYPVNAQRIYCCGLSGGAMGSYDLANAQPQLIKGMIANTGMMPFGSDPPCNDPLPKDFPKDKIIVMLASPTDFRYRAMLRNKLELEEKGWKIKWIEFTGGHTLAPEQCYDEAVNWLNQQP